MEPARENSDESLYETFGHWNRRGVRVAGISGRRRIAGRQSPCVVDGGPIGNSIRWMRRQDRIRITICRSLVAHGAERWGPDVARPGGRISCDRPRRRERFRWR